MGKAHHYSVSVVQAVAGPSEVAVSSELRGEGRKAVGTYQTSGGPSATDRGVKHNRRLGSHTEVDWCR